MTMPYERTRAMIRAGALLVEIAQDASLPLQLRRQAVGIARHFPTIEEVDGLGLLRCPLGGSPFAGPHEVPAYDALVPGALRYSTRLTLPEEGAPKACTRAPRKRGST